MKNTPLIIAVVLILVAAIGGYFFMQSKSGSQMIGLDNNKMIAENGGSSMTSLKELMSMGSNQMCTFSYSSEDGSNEGTTYIASNKVRTDFTGSDSTGESYEGSMIMDGEFMYTWTTDTNQGIKMPITETMEQEVEKAQENPDEYKNEYIDPDVKTDYKCSAWNVDNSKFIPPSTITFMDMSEQMKAYDEMMQQNQSSDMQNACAACDSLTGEAQAACKQALSC